MPSRVGDTQPKSAKADHVVHGFCRVLPSKRFDYPQNPFVVEWMLLRGGY